MTKLASMLPSFSKPNLTPEQWAEIDRRAEENAKAEAEQKRRERLERSGVPLIYQEAKLALCEAPVKSYKDGSLLLQGKPGRGKTYSACAILMDRIDKHPVRFVTMEKLLRECKACFNGQDTEANVIGRYTGTRLLCLDDIGKERLTEWSLPIFFSIINERLENDRPTIITTNYTGAELMSCFTVNNDEQTAYAIVSRMSGYQRIVLEGEDRRIVR